MEGVVERYDSWMIAQSKNTTEQKLLNVRLQDLEKERSRSINLLNVERGFVRREHSKLLCERKFLAANQSHFETWRSGAPSAAAGTTLEGLQTTSLPTKNAWVVKDDEANARIQARVDCWTSAVSRRQKSATTTGVELPALVTIVEVDNEGKGDQRGSDGGVFGKAGDKSSKHSRYFEKSKDYLKPTSSSPFYEEFGRAMEGTASSQKSNVQGSNSEEIGDGNLVQGRPPGKLTHIRAPAFARSDVSRRMARMKMMSQIPEEFDIRSKRASVERSGKPKLNMNAFQDHRKAKKGKRRRHSERTHKSI